MPGEQTAREGAGWLRGPASVPREARGPASGRAASDAHVGGEPCVEERSESVDLRLELGGIDVGRSRVVRSILRGRARV